MPGQALVNVCHSDPSCPECYNQGFPDTMCPSCGRYPFQKKTDLTPELRIKREIISLLMGRRELDPDLRLDTPEAIDTLWEAWREDDPEFSLVGYIYDYEEDFRSGQVVTDIPSAGGGRHYETSSVAHLCQGNIWIGWTYFYGGGKHAEPAGIDWMSDAYELTCEERNVPTKFFTKVEA